MSHPNLKKYVIHSVSAASFVIGQASFINRCMADDLLLNNITDRNIIISDQYYLDIEINGVTEQEPVACFVNDNYIKIPIAVFKSHGVLIDDVDENQEYINIKDYPWIEITLDLTKQYLSLHIPAYKFTERLIEANNRKLHQADRQTPGVYLNYDYTANSTWPKQMRGVAGFNELVYFNAFGVGSFSGILQDYSNQKNAVRLETNWTYDHDKSLSSYKFGDAVSRPELWGGSVRFAGIQWSTNFDIQPNFSTFPLPSMKGQSTIPSTVDVYVNDALSLSRSVDRGPFLLNELPVVTGQGSVALVTQDILGRRQEVVIPYYATPNLLKPGLEDFSFETGWLRYGYGIQSNSYKQAMGSFTYRRGILPQWTVGLHSELTKPIKNVGASNQILLSDFGVLNQSAAVSKSKNGQGSLVAIGFNRQAQDLSFGMNNQVTYGKFSTIDMINGGTKSKLTSQFYAGYTHKRLGMVGLSYTERHDRKMASNKYLTLNYQKQFNEKVALNLFATRSFKHNFGDQVGITLSWQIDNKSSASATTQLQRQNSSVGFNYHRDVLADQKLGYDVIVSEGSRRHFEGRLNGQTNYTDYAFRAARDGNIDGIELNGRGSVVHLDGVTRAMRYVPDSFGMIKAEGLTGTMIYSNNQPVGQVDEDGILMLPQLNSYESNKYNIDYMDLPVNHVIERDHISLIPAKRTGVVGHLKAYKVKTVFVSLTDHNGEHLAPGTEVFEENTKQYSYVGMYGEVCFQIPDNLPQIKIVYIGAPSFNILPNTEESQPALNQIPGNNVDTTLVASVVIDVPSGSDRDGICHLGTHQCRF